MSLPQTPNALPVLHQCRPAVWVLKVHWRGPRLWQISKENSFILNYMETAAVYHPTAPSHFSTVHWHTTTKTNNAVSTFVPSQMNSQENISLAFSTSTSTSGSTSDFIWTKAVFPFPLLLLKQWMSKRQVSIGASSSDTNFTDNEHRRMVQTSASPWFQNRPLKLAARVCPLSWSVFINVKYRDH